MALIVNPLNSKSVSDFTPQELDLILEFTCTNLSLSQPETRSKVLSILGIALSCVKKRLYQNYREACKARKFPQKNPDAINTLEASIQVKFEFLRKFTALLVNSIAPCLPYRSVLSALTLLKDLVILFGVEAIPTDENHYAQGFPFSISSFLLTPRVVMRLISGLTSRFSNLQQLSFEILSQFPAADKITRATGIDIQTFLTDFAHARLKSVKAADADSAAWLFKYVLHISKPTSRISFLESILDLLDSRLALSRTDLAMACQEYPIHGVVRVLVVALKATDRTYGSEAYQRAYAKIREVCAVFLDLLTDESPGTRAHFKIHSTSSSHLF